MCVYEFTESSLDEVRLVRVPSTVRSKETSQKVKQAWEKMRKNRQSSRLAVWVERQLASRAALVQNAHSLSSLSLTLLLNASTLSSSRETDEEEENLKVQNVEPEKARDLCLTCVCVREKPG